MKSSQMELPFYKTITYFSHKPAVVHIKDSNKNKPQNSCQRKHIWGCFFMATSKNYIVLGLLYGNPYFSLKVQFFLF